MAWFTPLQFGARSPAVQEIGPERTSLEKCAAPNRMILAFALCDLHLAAIKNDI